MSKPPASHSRTETVIVEAEGLTVKLVASYTTKQMRDKQTMKYELPGGDSMMTGVVEGAERAVVTEAQFKLALLWTGPGEPKSIELQLSEPQLREVVGAISKVLPTHGGYIPPLFP